MVVKIHEVLKRNGLINKSRSQIELRCDSPQCDVIFFRPYNKVDQDKLHFCCLRCVNTGRTSSKKVSKDAKKFCRLCPCCNEEVFHTTEQARQRAEKAQKLCRSCSTKKLWQDPAYQDKWKKIRASEDYRRQRSEVMTRLNHEWWLDDNYRESQIERLRQVNTDKWKDPEKRERYMEILKNLNSKTTSGEEQKLAECAKVFGFEQGYQVDSLFPDLVNPKLGVILEYFGDLWHCNPAIYDAGFYNPFIKMTAQEKWDLDSQRVFRLEAAGYRVLILWGLEFKKSSFDLQNWLIDQGVIQ